MITKKLQAAIKLAQQNNLPGAISIFEQVIASGVVDFKLYKTLGSFYQNNHQLTQATTNFKKSLNINPQQLDVNYTLAKIAQTENNHKQAIIYFTNALEINSSLASVWFNLAYSHQMLENFSIALKHLNKTLSLEPNNINALLAVANIYKIQKKYHDAEVFINKILLIQPNNFKALFNLAIYLDDQNKTAQAIKIYHDALKVNPNYADIYENLGLCYLKLQQTKEALSQFEQGLDISPYHLGLHNMCSSLRFELDHPDFLGRLKQLNKQQTPANIHEKFIKLLISTEQFSQATEEIFTFKKRHGNTPNIKHLYLSILSGQKKHHKIIEEIQCDTNNDSLFNVMLGKSYLAIGENKRALKIFEEQIKQFPTDQYLWAMYSTALRVINPERYAILCDYDNLIFTSQLKYPKNYGSLHNFNEALLVEIEKIHCTDKNPLEQSLVGGTQTPGFLFNQTAPIFTELKTSLKSTIYDIFQTASINKPSSASNHPVWSRWPNSFEFNTAWSVWLHSSGFHKSHIHSKGWYSSAYYVSVPNTVNNSTEEGYLKFGDIPFETKEKFNIEKTIKPEAGTLALFPSYVWHGTMPFESEQPRVSVAFDLLPNI